MEIVKMGKLPEEQLFHGTCYNCKTEFRCKKSEGRYENSQREGEFLRVKCPLCNKEAIGYPVGEDE